MMGTLSSELGPHVQRSPGEPRVYADANMPSGVVEYMRTRLRWDVFFVLEHEDLRRASDLEHFRLARQLGRTLLTQDRDYTDSKRFPPGEGAGVIVFSAPNERWLCRLLRQVDQELFRAGDGVALPLAGRTVERHIGE